jgi:cell division protein FtsI (penicillin-binding protein 3)
VIAIGIFALFSFLVVQFYQLQVVQHDKWTKLAEAQHTGLVREPFRRGTFWSNTSIKRCHPEIPQPLVRDVPKWHLHIDPASIPAELREEVAANLMLLVDLDGEKENDFSSHFAKRSRNRCVQMWLDRKTHDQIVEWWLPYSRKQKIARNAIFFVKDYQRSYPFGQLLGQALHTIRDRKDETTKQGIPTGGLEARFNELLKGKQGKRLRARTPRHPLDEGRVIEAPEDGADVYLTVNHVLQAIAEEEVEERVKKAEAKAGWAVVMRPQTGEILALAQYPSFYPERYREYFNDEERLSDAVVRGITHAYEPGSVMKALTLAVAFSANAELERRGEKPLFSPEEKIDVRDGRLPGRGSRPIKDLGTHSHLNMEMAIMKSSNIYVARLMERVVERLGDQWYHDTLQELFRFGEKTGIELPGETAGFLPAPGDTAWSRPTPYSLAMGYNILVNSLQMLRAFAAIANGGQLVEPTLVRKIVRGDEVIYDIDDRLPPPQVLDPAVCRRIVRAMKYTTKPGGTAKQGDVPGYTEAGKTGTTEKVIDGTYHKKTNFTTFIGFAPAEEPELIILIAVDEPKWMYIPGVGTNHMGGSCAAPLFREIAKRSLDYLGTPLDDPHGYPTQDPRFDAEKADWVAEAKQLRETFEAWNNG